MISSIPQNPSPNRIFSKKWCKTYFFPLLVILLAFSFLVRMHRITYPNRYVFDEVYHSVTAKLIARNDPQAFEWWGESPEPDTAVDWLHPPYAKYTQAAAMLVFGENALGWRFSSVVFGVGVIGLTALLALQLFDDHRLALAAATLASFDGLLLTQSRVAMNDIHVTFMILLTVLLYVKYRHFNQLKWLVAACIAAGVALGTKWSGAFILAWIGIWEGWYWLTTALKWHISGRSFSSDRAKWLWQHPIRLAILLFLVPAILYIAAYWQMFLLHGKTLVCQGSEPESGKCYRLYLKNDEGVHEDTGRLISHFHELHRQIWNYQTTLEATHNYQSRPWQWFLNLRPVWFHVEYGLGVSEDKVAHIYALGNPALFWLGDAAVLISIGLLLYVPIYILIGLANKIDYSNYSFKKVLAVTPKLEAKAFKASRIEPLAYQPLAWLVSAYLIVWSLWIVSPRIMFFYHYTPAVPFLSIILAWVIFGYLSQAKLLAAKSEMLGATVVVLVGIVFIVWLPVWTGMPISIDLYEKLYTVVKSWK